MLVVISQPHTVPEEAEIINGLFDAGMELFHLRRPGETKEKLEALLKKINDRYYPRIVLHQQHELGSKFNINRMHFTEVYRLRQSEESLRQLVEEGQILSTSVHLPGDLHALLPVYSYSFLGPLFGSISKPGYTGRIPPGYSLLPGEHKVRPVALGGIDESNIGLVRAKNFTAAALLGAVWLRANPLDSFRKLQQLWKQAE